MISTLTTLVIGFSIFSAPILLFAYAFFLPGMQKTRLGISACSVLLLGLIALQLSHLQYLGAGVELFDLKFYVAVLLFMPVAFYFFSREVLLPTAERSAVLYCHLILPVLGLFLRTDIAAPAAFLLGACYTVWFARLVYGLRRHLARFRFEMFFFGLFALLAITVLILVFLIPETGSGFFYTAYANFIGLSMVLVMAVLIIFPELLSDISDAASLAYSNSTLGGVDVQDKLATLDRLMATEKLFANENLNLRMTAQAMDLTSHQLSELINTQFGHSFSRYIREQRVTEAKRLLVAEETSSILAISLESGFRSQSNFYTAFREVCGEAPGTYRKRLLDAPESS